ncbi:MAG: putative DNA-binding domain-containing protein [Yoonia sp.]|nr:putative DNA-binding domain-containing protein [Yoonia sp.]
MTVTQTEFRKGLLDPTMPAPVGLLNPDGTQATKRFDVYRNNVAVSLSDALESAFPIIRRLVGDKFFRAMAGVYLRKHPPTSPLMMFYGDLMPKFLRRFDPAKSLPYLPDMAKLELAMRHAYHAADADPIDAAALGALAPDKLMGAQLTLAPATTVIVSQYPIYSIYRANTVPDAPKAVMQPESLVITRPAFDPIQHRISPASAACITALDKGIPLGVAMSAAGRDFDLGATLGLLLGQGAVTSLN